MSISKNQQRHELQQALKRGVVPELVIPGWNPDKELFYYQKTGVAWLYVTPRALLADSTGTGKTAHGLALLQRLKSKGRLSPGERAIVICPSKSVLGSWKKDGFDDFVPDMKVAVAGGASKKAREEIYADPTWEVLLINYELVLRDLHHLLPLNFQYAILDEVHYVRNHETQTAIAVKKITVPCKRVVGMTATPIQNHLLDLHGILEVLGLGNIFGPKEVFARKHHEYRLVNVRYNGVTAPTKKLVGLKNTRVLKQMIEPYYMRRRYGDITIPLPSLKHQKIWLDLSPKQQKLYDDIKAKEVKKLGPDAHIANLRNTALRLQQAAVTTRFFIDDDYSTKFDWTMEHLKGDWQEDKVILFSKWHPSLRAMAMRLKDAGIGFVVITGNESKKKREAARQTFWNNPDCKVLLGTTAIEESLNLQCARIQLNLDMLWNPARHDQLAGRHRRVGSIYDEVFVFSLLMRNTIEEAVWHTLNKKQAVNDHMFDEQSDIFETLSAAELWKLIIS